MIGVGYKWLQMSEAVKECFNVQYQQYWLQLDIKPLGFMNFAARDGRRYIWGMILWEVWRKFRESLDY